MRVLLIVALIAAASATLPTTVVTTGTSKASTTSTVNAESTEYTPTEATTTTTLKSTTAAATTKASTKSKSAVTLTSKAASNTTTTKSNSTTSTSTVAPNTTESTTNNYWTMLGVPECMRTCVTPLGPAWDAVMTLNNTVEKLYSLCGNWTAVNTCTLKTKAKGCFPRPMLIKGYNALTSGVKMTCLNKKPLWKVDETCLKKNNTLDTVLQACDAKCGYRGNMTAFQSKMPTVSKGQDQGDFSSFVAQLGNLCDSMACALPCVRDQLNKACVTTGNLAMASYVPPIEELSSFLKFGPLKLRQKVKKVVPASCSALLEDAYLRKLKLGLKL